MLPSFLPLRSTTLLPSIIASRLPRPYRFAATARQAVFKLLFTSTLAATMATATSTHSIVYVTTPSKTVAETLATSLLSSQLCACVNILPGVTSMYVWKGAIETSEEALMMIKTTTERVPALTAHVQSTHPYETCEVVAVPITSGSTKYLDWVTAAVKAKEEL